LYFLTNWLPIITSDAGLTVREAILATAMFQIGGTVGALAIGRLADSFGLQRILGMALLCAAAFIAAMGSMGKSFFILDALAFGAGFCVVGGQIGANALAGTFYPPPMRSTGVGWALGIGRFGAVVGPLIGGALLHAKVPTGELFLAGAVPSICAALAIIAMAMASKTRRPA
ncbi:MAG TPA: MFS transporter, partial [Hyphomicrobiales bacterium]|nr:MFS transporter [Hyphomicrobiales bacterium]